MPDLAVAGRADAGLGRREAAPQRQRAGGRDADSPGYSSEQSAEEAHLRGLLLDLSTTVSTHPFWQTLQGPDLVAARMELKQTTLAPATEAH
ncbi:hypothetical protein [Streptomyces sp. NPDC059076]|uniref:hypothetical protein n=1 Tax=unclassified Streptomyces TaxID=2593676 RepID=UPI003681F9D8